MTTLLHIDASAQTDRSISRHLSKQFMKTWLSERPDDTVARRDLSKKPPSFVTEAWIAACFTPEVDRTVEMHEALHESDELIAELAVADLVVLGVPMYNYGMPSVLKAWVDQVVRVGKTFSFDLARGDYPVEPIFSGKTLVTVTSKGEFGFAKGDVREDLNFLDGHIESVAHYLGLTERYFVHSEFQEFADARHEKSRSTAEADTIMLAKKLSKARA